MSDEVPMIAPEFNPQADLRLPEQSPEEAEVRFGRSRVLKAFGAALFGAVAGSIVKAQPSWASHEGPPGPCYGLRKCHSCSGSTCTLSTCGYYGSLGCPTGGQCWQACYSNCIWNCCDWQWTANGEWRSCLCGTCIAGSRC